ncbi:MAG: hypothetical protein ABI702_03655 [Burkholderiales bacterium]
MKTPVALLAAAALAVLSGAAPAAGLTPANYVEVGDTIVDMLDTSVLAFSTMLISRVDTPRPMLASFAAVSTHTQSFTMPCPGGGSVASRMVDRDASGDVSVRDRFVTVFHACRIDGETLSGSSEFVIAANRTLNGVETTELEFRFRQLGSDAMRWDGAARAVLRSDLKSGAEQYTVTYQDMAVVRGARAMRWRLTMATQHPPLGDHTAQIDGALVLEHDTVQLVQNDPFVIAPGGKPRAGLLTATDAGDDRLEVEAGRRFYRYRFYARGNRTDTPDSHSQSKPHGGS